MHLVQLDDRHWVDIDRIISVIDNSKGPPLDRDERCCWIEFIGNRNALSLQMTGLEVMAKIEAALMQKAAFALAARPSLGG